MRAAALGILAALLLLLGPWRPALGQKVFLNPSNQTGNPVSGGGTEDQYALILANLTQTILTQAGFDVVVDQDFTNAPSNANSWGADIFVSMHTNAGGSHGTETLYLSDGGKVLATSVQAGLVASVGYADRGLVHRTDLHVLNSTAMYASLEEAVFHDCDSTSGYKGHPPSESDFLRSAGGQAKIAAGVADGACAYFKKTCAAAPEKGWLKGTVYEAPDLARTLEGATVSLGTGGSTVTSSTGAFSFELAPGTYQVTATKQGFEPGSATVAVTAAKDTWESIGLIARRADGGPPDGGPVEASLGDSGVGDGARGHDGGTPRPEEGCTCGVGAVAPPGDLDLRPLLWVVLLGYALGRSQRSRAGRRRACQPPGSRGSPM
jgi:N-acetylmuramoyl-L-alanine amidase